VTLSWTAPTTNRDGTPLRDLAGYRLYLDTRTPTCPGGPFLAVPSPAAAPASAQTVSDHVTGLTASTTYFARVTAVDTSGNESTCSPAASGVALKAAGKVGRKVTEKLKETVEAHSGNAETHSGNGATTRQV